ncbi:MAG: hypothetical protein FJ320_11625 [SAR202 cluster bacterium]|nr:hypothetical protein [SAR202 cluster bacterium]
MTQIARYAQFKKVEIKSVKGWIKLNLTMTGSVLQETIDSGASSIETRFEVESSADAKVVEGILRLARKGCWARQMIEKGTRFDDTLVLNGKDIKLTL